MRLPGVQADGLEGPLESRRAQTPNDE